MPLPRGLSTGGGGGAATDASLSTTDVTTNDVTSTKHGFAPKSPGDANKILSGAATPAWVYPAFVGCRVTNSANIDLPNTTFTRATWDTETYDTSGIHEGVTNPGRMTIPAGMTGYWLFSANIFITNVTTNKFAQINLYKNGSNSGFSTRLAVAGSISDSGGQTLLFTTILSVAAADYFEMFCYQDSGGTLTGGISLSSQTGFFEARFLGV